MHGVLKCELIYNIEFNNIFRAVNLPDYINIALVALNQSLEDLGNRPNGELDQFL